MATLAPSEQRTAPRILVCIPTVGRIGGAFFGLVLLAGAVSKALDPAAFAELVGREGLDLLLSAQATAHVALALEVGLGVLLLLGVRRRWTLVPAALLVALFLFLNARAWAKAGAGGGLSTECGCFGSLIDRTPAEAFWQDLLLLVPGLGLAFLGRREDAFPWRRTGAAGLATAAVVVFAVLAPDLPLDDLTTRLRVGLRVQEICAGKEPDRVCLADVIPELAEGRHVVVIVALDDPRFVEDLPRLNEHVLGGVGPTLWVLSDAPKEKHEDFKWARGPSFDTVPGPRGLLRRLYRRLPRCFLVENGQVTRLVDGLPPPAMLEEP